ncbi:MAG: nuclear transport factor 2 family protein [Pseudomonadota bacterium]
MPNTLTKILLVVLLLNANVMAAETEEQKVIELTMAWTEAMRTRDLESLYPMMHQNFRLLTEKGTYETGKGEWLLNTMHALTINEVEVKRPSAVVYGDVAVVSMRMELDWMFRGQPIPGSFDLVDTWIKTDQGWQVITRVSSEVKE